MYTVSDPSDILLIKLKPNYFPKDFKRERFEIPVNISECVMDFVYVSTHSIVSFFRVFFEE